MGEWGVQVGEAVRRVELHDRYGGGRQGGIAPSRTSGNVLIFSDPTTGSRHGYDDRWVGDEFHYVGEGQTGNQVMARGNAAILNHRASGKALRLFWGAKGVVEYAGEFELAHSEPWYTARARETGGETMRNVITFRLLPKGRVETPVDGLLAARKHVRPWKPLSTAYRSADEAVVSTEREPFLVDPDAVDRGLIGHARTQNLLAAAAAARGLEVLSPGPGDPDFDLAWAVPGGLVVVEVKSLTTANEAHQLRLGLGQVLDYAHTLSLEGGRVTSVLAVERQPGNDRWRSICASAGVTLLWPDQFDRFLAED